MLIFLLLSNKLWWAILTNLSEPLTAEFSTAQERCLSEGSKNNCRVWWRAVSACWW